MSNVSKVRGQDLYDWEGFPKDQKGHDEIVRLLRTVLVDYGLKVWQFNPKEVAVAWHLREGAKPHPYVPHEPDLIASAGDRPEDRIFIEYVNSAGPRAQNFLRDLRGMLALSAVMKHYYGFLVVVRESCITRCWTTLKGDSPVRIMRLRIFFDYLDNKDYGSLVGKRRLPTTDRERSWRRRATSPPSSPQVR
jgi:hypothetical protein